MKHWLGGKPRVLVFGHADCVSARVRGTWRTYLEEKEKEEVRFVDGKNGKGVGGLKQVIVQAGQGVNERRLRKGLRERAVRCLVVGFPNVGKSSLINKLVGRKIAKTQQKPGVTRTVQWVRVGGKQGVEMLDMPGVIPVKVLDRVMGIRLAICDEIGEAAYDKQVVAGALVDEIKRMNERFGKDWADLGKMEDIMKWKVNEMSGAHYVKVVAEKLYSGDVERVAVRLLTDLRRGNLGLHAFEAPEMIGDDPQHDPEP